MSAFLPTPDEAARAARQEAESDARADEEAAVLTGPSPGPWRDSPKAADAIIADDPRFPVTTDTDRWYGGFVVAESVTGLNKALIKAAPDLYAALEAYRTAAAVLITDYVVPVLQARGEHLPESVCAAFNEARRLAVPAIAKAEGRDV